MSVERRSTRRSTAENRIVVDPVETELVAKDLIADTTELKKSVGIKRKEVAVEEKEIVQDENCVTTTTTDGPVNEAEAVMKDDEDLDAIKADEILDDEDLDAIKADEILDDDAEGAPPDAKIPKLDNDEEETNGNGQQQGKPKKKAKVTYPCPECDKRFLKKSFLTKHIKFHSAPRPFVCEYEDCERSFIQKKDLLKHVKVFHEGQEEGLHLCQFCQKGFITRSEMECHAETHLQEYKMYACRFCGKTFNKKFAMKIAVQASQDSTVDPCPYCNRGINAKAYSDK